MKPNELRIGNYLEFRHPTMGWSTAHKCESWMIKDVGLVPESYRPIPLSEEWLVRLGFIGGMKGGIALGSKFDINFYDSMGICVKTIYVEYVHQLQNLYFALTNEELELK